MTPISPVLIQDLNNLAIPIVLALGAAAWKWIDTHSPLKGTQAEAIARGAYMDLLDKGAEFGVTQMDSGLTKVGAIDIENPAIAAGANFVITHGADLAAKMGFDIETDDGRAAIIRSVTARIGTILANAQDGKHESTMPMLTLPESVALAGSPVTRKSFAALGPIPPSH